MHLTEKELLTRQREQLYGIQKLIQNSKLNLDDLSELIPGVLHLNKIHSLDLFYVDRQTREVLEIDEEEVSTNGSRILKSIVKPESFQYAKKLFGHLDFEDPSLVISHFQALRGVTRKEYSWFYSVKKRFNDQLILTISTPLDTLTSMQKEIEKILEENQFIRQNLPKMDRLTPREKEIIRLITRGNTSTQMAEMLCISTHTVRTHRKNIWKKLDITHYTELLKYAEQFDLQ